MHDASEAVKAADRLAISFSPRATLQFQKWAARQNPRDGVYAILACYEEREPSSSEEPSSCKVNLFDIFPYQPHQESNVVCGAVLTLFEHTVVRSTRLGEHLVCNGVPLLRCKDNELAVYCYNRMHYLLHAVCEFVAMRQVNSVAFAVDSGRHPFVPEWPNIARWINWDAYYGPWVARAVAAAAPQVRIHYAGLSSAWWARMLDHARSAMFAAARLKTVTQRAWAARSYATPTEPRPIAFWVRSASQVREVESLFHGLPDAAVNCDNAVFLQDDSFVKEDCLVYLRAKALPFVSLHRYLTLSILAGAVIRWLKYRFVDSRQIEFVTNQQAQSGSPAAGILVSGEFSIAVARSLAEAIFSGYINVKELRKATKTFGTKLMLNLNAYDQWGAISGYLGQSIGYRTACVQSFALNPIRLPSPYQYYDAVLTFDRAERARIMDSGGDPDRVLVLGRLLSDTLLAPGRALQDRHEMRALLQIPENAVFLLCATQSFSSNAVEENAPLVETVLRAARRNSSLFSVIKIHPYEKLEHYRAYIDLARDERLAVQFIAETPIDSLLHACDLFLTRFSITINTAVLCGKPVISLLGRFEVEWFAQGITFIKEGYVNVVHDVNAADEAIDDLLIEEHRLSASSDLVNRLHREFPEYDGRAAIRFNDYVKRMLCTSDQLA